MVENPVAFIKYDQRISWLSLFSLTFLPVGGNEGAKSLTELRNPRYIFGREDIAPTLIFISKEYPANKKDCVMDIVNAYEVLREKGYPVPNTIRYYERDKTVNLLMSDMTEGGKYKIWGFSDFSSPEQQAELESMALTDKDILNIQELVFELSNKATNDGLLSFYFYHSGA